MITNKGEYVCGLLEKDQGSFLWLLFVTLRLKKEIEEAVLLHLLTFISAEETLDMVKSSLEKDGFTKVTWTAFNEIPSE